MENGKKKAEEVKFMIRIDYINRCEDDNSDDS